MSIDVTKIIKKGGENPKPPGKRPAPPPAPPKPKYPIELGRAMGQAIPPMFSADSAKIFRRAGLKVVPYCKKFGLWTVADA